MTNTGAIVSGAILLGIAILGFLYPINDMGWSVPQAHELCSSGLGQLGQAFIGDIQKICLEFRYITYGIYALGLIGIILVIVGVVISSKSKEKTMTCAYCNFIATSETELLKHSSDKHLDKSPYKCGHCDFIGITEEILWNHYVEKHPNEKKW